MRWCHDPPSNPRFSKVASRSCTASRVSLLSQTSEAYWSLMTQTANYQQLFSSLLTHYTLPKLIFFFFGPLHIYFDQVWKEQCKYLSKVSYDKCGSMWHLLKRELIRKCGVGPTCYAARVGRGKLLWVCVSSCLATQWSRHRAWEPVSEHPGPMTDADTAVTYFMPQFTQLAILEYQIAIVLQRVKECMKCADK